MTDERRDVLEALLTSPGWSVFVHHVETEWGPNGATYQQELDKALDLTDSAAAASQARQVRAGRKVIEMLLAWPSQEIARLKRQEPDSEPVLSRRGGL